MAALMAPAVVAAQSAEPSPTGGQKVTITGQMIAAPLDVGGFGDVPLARTPMAASVIGETRLRDAGAKSASDLARLDAAVSAAYDAEGYWTSISARGFQVDNRYNYRRDGLPVNGESVIHLGNKRAIELLKGTSGMLAGTSAPGGLVNFVVKRPTTRIRSGTIDVRDEGTVGVGTDLSERFGADDAFGVRLNAGYESLRPTLRDAEGKRSLVALAGDWRLTTGALLEAEVERSRQSQPSQPGFSLLGDTVPDPDAIDPRINLNNQPWSLPVVLAGTTASLRFTQEIAKDWRFVAHGMTQRLKNDDRVAFPYGVYDPVDYTCTLYCDRYAPDGTYTMWEFQSDNERRRSDALNLGVEGRAMLGGMTHRAAAGVLLTRHEARFGQQIFDIAGTGSIQGTLVVPRSPGFLDENTNRDERTREIYVRDAIEVDARTTLWLGLRSTHLNRASVRTDGTRATDYPQNLATPWLALTHHVAPRTMVYASWGQGIESEVAPNRPRYINAREPLPALKSRQVEIGAKHEGESLDASAAIFDIDRPATGDFGTCDADNTCTRRIDGSARHRGVEALVSWRTGPWTLHASGMLLDAKRRDSSDAAINGKVPTNVPRRTLRVHAAYDVDALPGLGLVAAVVHEGRRMAVPDNRASIPSWTRLDLAARWRMNPHDKHQLTWRVGVDNVFNERAWKEAPYQFGHAYLYPLAPRSVRASMQAAF